MQVRRALVRALVVAAVAVGVAGLAPDPAQAARTRAAVLVHHVSTTGSDTTGDGSQQRPWRTIAKATAAAPSGGIVEIAQGTYAPFTVTKAGQTVRPLAGQAVVVQGAPGVQDVIRISASDVTVQSMTVTGCVPNPNPANGFENNGSSGVRINDGANNVTVQDMVVRDSHGVNSYNLPFGCYGILVHRADGSKLLRNEILHNGSGIYFNGGGRSAQVTGNRIHDNDVIIRNTPGNDDDYGGGAIAFTNLTAAPGPTASKNVLTNNAGPSSDYQADGGGFELYNASNLRIVDNTLVNNENVLETGTGPGGTCANNTFSGNTATGRTAGSTLDKSIGMILRCATKMVIDRNSFTEIDWWVFDIELIDQFSSGVTGLVISNNTINQWQKVYHLGVDPVANKITIDRNKIHFTGPIFSSYADGTTSPGVADWRLRSGLDLRSTEY